MSLQVKCDAPASNDCAAVADPEHLPSGWITATEHRAGKELVRHFCGWRHLKAKAYCLESSDNCK